MESTVGYFDVIPDVAILVVSTAGPPQLSAETRKILVHHFTSRQKTTPDTVMKKTPVQNKLA